MNKYIIFLILIAGCRGKTEINTTLYYRGIGYSGWSVIRPGDTIFIGKDTVWVSDVEQDVPGWRVQPRPLDIPIRPDTIYIHDTLYLRSKSTNINRVNTLNIN